MLGSGRKSPNVGTNAYREYLACRFYEGVEKGSHRRSVYRLGVGCKDSMAGMSHAWIVVAQPDGTFYWLQSFISHYSLATWMKKKDSSTESGVAGVLTFDELMGKLDAIERLMSITSWTSEANRDYQDLFNVDKNLESAKWKEDWRLDYFSWDEACEYPAGGEHDAAGDGEDGSECVVMLKMSSLVNLLLDGLGEKDLAHILSALEDEELEESSAEDEMRALSDA